jgi:DNA-binding transcriptional LysR family regulator
MTHRIDSRSLTLFLAVADTLSFRQAAERLHMSQPPLSRSIREFEERLGMRLFKRDTRGVSLTAAGQRLLPRARRIMTLLHEAEQALAAGHAPTLLRLGVTNAVETDWFRGLVARIDAACPGLAIATESGASPKLIRLLRAQQLDAAFIALPTEAEGLHVTQLERQPMVVAMNAAHRLARRRTVCLADLQRERLFWFERARQPAFFDHCQRIFARHGFAPNVVREPSDHVVLLAGIIEGSGLALLPKSFMSLKRAGLIYRPLKEGDELAVGVGLATPHDRSDLNALLMRCAQSAKTG